MTRADKLQIAAVFLILFLLFEGLAIRNYLRWRQSRRAVKERANSFRYAQRLSDDELKQLYVDIGTVGIVNRNWVFICELGLMFAVWAVLTYWFDFGYLNQSVLTVFPFAFMLMVALIDKIRGQKNNRLLKRAEELGGTICIECAHELATNPPPGACPQCGLPIRMEALQKAWLGGQ